MTEHDIHHRSQIDTYAGMNGWDPPDIYGRAAETIAGLQESSSVGSTGEGAAPTIAASGPRIFTRASRTEPAASTRRCARTQVGTSSTPT